MANIALTEKAQLSGALRLEDVLRLSPIGMAVMDFDGTYESVNAAYCTIYGYAQDELLGQNVTMVFTPENHQQILNLHQTFLIEGGTLAGECQVVRSDGTVFHVISDSVCILGLDGRKRRLVYATNITERRRIEIELEAKQKFKHSILDSLVATICVVDENGIILSANQAWKDFYVANGGASDFRHEGTSYLAACESALISQSSESKDAKMFISRFNEILTGHRDRFELEYPCHSPTEQRWFLLKVTRLRDSNPARIVILHENVTALKLAESKLQLAASVFTHAREGALITNADGCIIDVNDTFCRFTGYQRDEVLGQNPRILNSGRQDKEFYEAMWRDIINLDHWSGELWNRRKGGEIFPVVCTISVIRDDQGLIHHFIALFFDISERKRLEEELRQLALNDPLTKLPNRRALYDRLRLGMAASKRSAHYGAVMILDLDNFKTLNDKHGHLVGDLLLIEVAKRLTSCVRETDTVARFGGDEFVVMLGELDTDQQESTSKALLIAEKIRKALAAPYLLMVDQLGQAESTVEHPCTATIGAAMFVGHEASQDDILKWADAAMYQAKSAGRNVIRFYEKTSTLNDGNHRI